MKKYNRPEMVMTIINIKEVLLESINNPDIFSSGDNFFPDFS